MPHPPPPADHVSEPQTHCVVGGAHAFILRISSFFGLAPLQFKPHDKGFTVSLSSGMCIYSYILITLLVILTIFGLVSEINAGEELSVRMKTRTAQVVVPCQILLVVATASVGVYGAPKRMRVMLGFMEKVAKVDSSIGGQYSGLTEKKLCAVLLAILVIFFVLILDEFCFFALQARRIDRHWETVTNLIGYYSLWYVVVILELQFAVTAWSVRARFRAVNDALAITARQVAGPIDIQKSSPRNINAIRVTPMVSQRLTNVSLLVNSTPTEESTMIVKRTVTGEPRLIVTPCEAIRRLAVLHGTLCEVVHSINKSYGLPLILIIISILLHFILTSYFIAKTLIVSISVIHMSGIHTMVLKILWCVVHTLRMFGVVQPCYYTINERKRTEGIICRMMTSTSSTGELSSRLELFSRQLMLQSVIYSPMGMCTLDRQLVVSVVGAITTYVVIIIQFQINGN